MKGIIICIKESAEICQYYWGAAEKGKEEEMKDTRKGKKQKRQAKKNTWQKQIGLFNR